MKAFPVEYYGREEGMDLRDYFAAKAMQGLLQCYHNPKEFSETLLAVNAYEVADAMMKARGQE